MSMLEEKEVYTLKELMDIFDIPKEEYQNVLNDIKNNRFPIPVLKIRNNYLFPKKPIDDFLEGFKYGNVRSPWQKIKQGRPRKWIPSETKHINIPITIELDNKFDEVCRNINKTIPAPLGKGDFIRLAMEEFIERRPEFQ